MADQKTDWYQYFYPDEDKIAIALFLFSLVFVATVALDFIFIDEDTFFILKIFFYIAGVYDYVCTYPIFTFLVALGFAYPPACYVVAKRRSRWFTAILLYGFFLVEFFKLLSYFFPPLNCYNI